MFTLFVGVIAPPVSEGSRYTHEMFRASAERHLTVACLPFCCVPDYVFFENSSSNPYLIRRIEELNKVRKSPVCAASQVPSHPRREMEAGFRFPNFDSLSFWAENNIPVFNITFQDVLTHVYVSGLPANFSSSRWLYGG